MNNNNSYHISQWKHLIPDIEKIISEIESVPILSVGITPYTRIVPAFFLKNYSLYTVQKSSDVDIMRDKLKIFELEDKYPAVAKKVHGTGYLIGNYNFQAFVKSRVKPPYLMFYTVTDKIVEELNKMGMKWIGNEPKTFDTVKNKGPFRSLLKELNLSVLDVKSLSRSDFLESDFDILEKEMQGSFVVQRADKEVGGNEGTFFIHNIEDFKHCISVLSEDLDFSEINVAPFIEGQSLSMLGCVMKEGTLSGPLQLQLIDVPESLHGVKPNGIFFGNDIGFKDWDESLELEAQKVVESIGNHLSDKGYLGVFGIDFLYDTKRKKLFANECNPRFTGSLVLYSLTMLEAHIPPMEFFHILAHLKIEYSFDFELVNKALKTRKNFSHVSFSPKGISNMNLPLKAGVYNYNFDTKDFFYKSAGLALNDLKDENDFMVIDTVPNRGGSIEQNVPRLFKFIFPRSIAKSSKEIDEKAAFLINKFSSALVKLSDNNTDDIQK